jgi:sulfopyruvate decarboxylase TPP-binding subunit
VAVPHGPGDQPVLEAMGVICVRIERPEEVVPATTAAITMAYKAGNSVAVLLTQKLIGAKAF